MSVSPDTNISVATETRDEILRPLLRGGQTWDELLRAMAAQYDPEHAAQTAERQQEAI